jgi:hypothetical protein
LTKGGRGDDEAAHDGFCASAGRRKIKIEAAGLQPGAA